MRSSLLCCLLALAACSASGSSATTACAQLAAATCAKIEACVKGGVTHRYGDEATCEARQAAACVASLGANATGNTTETVTTCATTLPQSTCAEYEASDVAVCAPQAGTRIAGATCTYSAQCATSFCAIAIGTNCGVCAAATSVGDSCAASTCARGQTCVASTQTCQIAGAQNANCDKDHPCGYQLSCVTPAAPNPGTCLLAGTTVGATCDPKRESAPACDGNSALVCEPGTKACAAATYTTAGGACGLVAQKVVSCGDASVCFGAMGATPGTCKAIVKEGAACDTAAGPSCMAPARCVTGSAAATAGTCALPDPVACG